jgi:pilus assembly protein TadC
MTKYLVVFAVVFGVAAWVAFLLLPPWFTYARAYLVIGGMMFVGASAALYLAWRARSLDDAARSSRSRYLVLQGIGLFAIGMAWLFITHHFLLRK